MTRDRNRPGDRTLPEARRGAATRRTRRGVNASMYDLLHGESLVIGIRENANREPVAPRGLLSAAGLRRTAGAASATRSAQPARRGWGRPWYWYERSEACGCLGRSCLVAHRGMFPCFWRQVGDLAFFRAEF